jgi:hypothetical protein
LNYIISSLEGNYTEDEMNEMLNFKLSQEVPSFRLTMDKFILNPAFVRNFQYSSDNPNFYFVYGYLCGRALLVLMALWTVFGFIYRKLGFKMFTQTLNIYLMTYLALSMLRVSFRKSFVFQSFFYGLGFGCGVRITNFLKMPNTSIFTTYFDAVNDRLVY